MELRCIETETSELTNNGAEPHMAPIPDNNQSIYLTLERGAIHNTQQSASQQNAPIRGSTKLVCKVKQTKNRHLLPIHVSELGPNYLTHVNHTLQILRKCTHDAHFVCHILLQ